MSQDQQKPKQWRRLYVVSLLSYKKHGESKEYAESIKATFEDYAEAYNAAKQHISETKGRRVTFLQVFNCSEDGGRGFKTEYTIRRSPIKTGGGTLQSEAAEIESYKKREERKQRRRQAYQIAKAKGLEFADVLKELNREATEAEKAERRETMKQIKEAKKAKRKEKKDDERQGL